MSLVGALSVLKCSTQTFNLIYFEAINKRFEYEKFADKINQASSREKLWKYFRDMKNSRYFVKLKRWSISISNWIALVSIQTNTFSPIFQVPARLKKG